MSKRIASGYSPEGNKMFIVWTEKDGGRLFYNSLEAEQYAAETEGRIEEVTETSPDKWWVTA